MPKCPNCGRETRRTADWACQWCGHPLLSGSFKKIPQTYRELQEERSFSPRAVPENEPEPAIEAEVAQTPPPAPVAEPEPEPEPEPEVSPPPEPVVEAKAEVEVEKEPAPPPEPETETVADSEPTEATEPATVEEPEAKAEPASEPATMEEPEAEPAAEVEPEIATRPAPPPTAVPSLEPDPTTGAISATAEELNAAFNADKVGTNNRLMNRLLKVTGNVDKIFAKDHLDIFYIILAGARKPANWQVRCTFSREQGMYLSRLTEGQSATVQGTYAGYERNIILKDCALLQ